MGRPIPLIVVLTALPWLMAPDWNEFRGPGGRGVAEHGSPPVAVGPDAHIAWKVPVAGAGWSSPVLAGGRVYLTTAVPAGGGAGGLSLRAVALDVATGKVAWNVEALARQAGADRPHPKGGHASPTPFVSGDAVYVHFGPAGTARLSTKDGSRVWANRDLTYDSQHGAGGSPVLVGDKLVFSIDGNDRREVVGLDAATGKVAWVTPRDARAAKGFSFGTPTPLAVNGRTLVVSAGSDVVQGLDPADGREVWRVRYKGYSQVPRPVAGDGLVYVVTGYDSPILLAIRPDGTGDVTDTHVAWTAKRNVPANPTPLFVGDALYLVSDAGVLSCLDAKTGGVRWAERLGGEFTASPVSAVGHVYLFSEAGAATVFRPGPAYEPVATTKLAERVLATPAPAGDALFVRTAGNLYKFAE